VPLLDRAALRIVVLDDEQVPVRDLVQVSRLCKNLLEVVMIDGLREKAARALFERVLRLAID
jgi:hypothetical protein